MNLQAFEVAVSVLTLLGGGAGIWVLLRKSVALNEVANAQLKRNHGSSMVDLVNQIPDMLESIKTLIALITENHAEAQREWDNLRSEDIEMNHRLDEQAEELRELNRMADTLRVDLPKNIALLTDVRERVTRLEEIVKGRAT